MVQPCIFFNGKICRPGDVSVSPWDRGFLFGQGLFETLRSWNGVPFLVEEHEERLLRSVRTFDLPTPTWGTYDSLRGLLHALIRRSRIPDAYLRVMLTAGRTDHSANTAPTVCVLVRPLQPYDHKLYQRGAHVVISGIRRNPTCPLSAHKTLNYWSNLIARQAATEQNAIEAILLDARGYLAEGSCTNLFFFRNRRLYTPDLKVNILPGVTRAHVIRIARQANIQVQEGFFRLRSLLSAEEAFLTNALMGIMPISMVGRCPIGRAAPGPITRLLMELYDESVREHVQRFRSYSPKPLQ